VGWLRLEDVITLTEKDSEELESNRREGKLEFQVAENGEILICMNSIYRPA
jgi:hypothetical protein